MNQHQSSSSSIPLSLTSSLDDYTTTINLTNTNLQYLQYQSIPYIKLPLPYKNYSTLLLLLYTRPSTQLYNINSYSQLLNYNIIIPVIAVIELQKLLDYTSLYSEQEILITNNNNTNTNQQQQQFNTNSTTPIMATSIQSNEQNNNTTNNSNTNTPPIDPSNPNTHLQYNSNRNLLSKRASIRQGNYI